MLNYVKRKRDKRILYNTVQYVTFTKHEYQQRRIKNIFPFFFSFFRDKRNEIKYAYHVTLCNVKFIERNGEKH